MIEEIKNINIRTKDLKNFGLLIGVILFIISFISFFNNQEYYMNFFYIAFSFIIIGLIIPKFLKPIYKIWMILAIVLGWFMTRIILSLVFFIIITPIGIFLRLKGKDFLNLKKDNQVSFWNKRDTKKEFNQNYEKQF